MNISYLTGKGNATPTLLFPSKNSFLYNLLAVIYDNFFKLVLGEVCKVSDVLHHQRRCKFNYKVIGK